MGSNNQAVQQSPRIKLFNHQAKVFNLSKDRNIYAFFLETGTGKTILALESAKYLYQQGKIKALIITAPKTVLKPVWIDTLFKYYTDMNFRIIQWIGGMNQEDSRLIGSHLTSAAKTRLLVFIVNIEAFSHARVYQYAHRICTTLSTAWFIDESTTIKTPGAKRTKQVLILSQLVEYKRILSGFPVLKSPEDLYTQLEFLHPGLTGHKSFYSFRNEFCITRKLDNRVTISIGPKNIDKLQALIEPYSSRILKKDCLDLPDKIHTRRSVEMTKEQIELYQQMKNEGYALIKGSGKETFATTILTQLEKLHQIANGILISAGAEFPCHKYQMLIDTIDNEIGDKQFLIWSCYVYNINSIQLLLLKHGIKIGAFYGRTGLPERNRDIELFHQGKLQALVLHPGTARFGLTLAEASYAFYFNNSFNLEHRLQSEDRIHRIGQVNKATYIDLITEGTIEDKILNKLQEKHNIGAEILGDEWEEWFH